MITEVLLQDCYVRLIGSFLQDRSLRMRIDHGLSSERRITAGVPQGSVLGPLLFSVFVNDTPRVAGVRLSLFAYDTAAFAAETNTNFAAIKRPYVGCAENWRVVLTLFRWQR